MSRSLVAGECSSSLSIRDMNETNVRDSSHARIAGISTAIALKTRLGFNNFVVSSWTACLKGAAADRTWMDENECRYMRKLGILVAPGGYVVAHKLVFHDAN